jgi:hypothetical protein
MTMKKFEQLAMEDQCRLLIQMLETLAEYDCSTIEAVVQQLGRDLYQGRPRPVQTLGWVSESAHSPSQEPSQRLHPN